MKYVIKIVGITGDVVTGDGMAGTWLKSYDPEAFDGRDAVATKRLDEALRFASHREAMELYLSTPKSRPLRDDGLPNRPLTAFTITVEPVDESGDRPIN